MPSSAPPVTQHYHLVVTKMTLISYFQLKGNQSNPQFPFRHISASLNLYRVPIVVISSCIVVTCPCLDKSCYALPRHCLGSFQDLFCSFSSVTKCADTLLIIDYGKFSQKKVVAGLNLNILVLSTCFYHQQLILSEFRMYSIVGSYLVQGRLYSFHS